MISKFGVLVVVASYIAVTLALPPCVCTRERKPVCGSDGETYSNECMFNCKRVDKPELRIEKSGPCEYEPPACFCTYEYAPVCGTNGVTYPNRCSLDCEKGAVDIAYEGACREKREDVKVATLGPCVCTREKRPVCGTNGQTYSNPCMLNCAREYDSDLHINHVGRCPDSKAVDAVQPPNTISCSCTRNLAPVCASNGITYNNECLMKCVGPELTIASDGPCESA